MILTINIHWWAVPVVIVILGIIVSRIFFHKNYNPGGYFGDWMTPLVTILILFVFVAIAIGVIIGHYLK